MGKPDLTKIQAVETTAQPIARNGHSSSSPSSALKPKPKRKIPWSNIWREIRYFTLVIVGAVVAAIGYSLFQVPYNIAAGGVSGIGIIINHFTGWPVGTMYFILNIPLLVLGFFYLGRWSFIVRTLLAVLIFSVTTDLLGAYLPDILDRYPVTDDILLSSVYAGLIGGIGGGLIYRYGGTMGGTGIVGRILQEKTGLPLSQMYLYTDGFIVLMAGLIFGWEIALYALLTLFLNGLGSDYTLEGPSSVRTATIITLRPREVSQALMESLGQSNSHWQITGSYSGEARHMLMCTIYRPQVNALKRILADVDPDAFLTIGVAHQALGAGFVPLKR